MNTEEPRLCLVTDRHRLMAAIGHHPKDWRRALLAQLAGAIAGGIDIIQVRERDLDARSLVDVVRAVVALARDSATRVVVNDRADVALAAAAHGVHLPQHGLTIDGARRLCGPGAVIGRSVHDVSSASESAGADYVIAGHVFPTASKPATVVPLGLSGLAAVVSAAPCPVWAIGGITEQNLAAIVAQRARGVASIGAFLPPAGTADLEAAARMRVHHLRAAFDGLRGERGADALPSDDSPQG